MTIYCTCSHTVTKHSDMDDQQEYPGPCLECECKGFVPDDEDEPSRNDGSGSKDKTLTLAHEKRKSNADKNP